MSHQMGTRINASPAQIRESTPYIMFANSSHKAKEKEGRYCRRSRAVCTTNGTSVRLAARNAAAGMTGCRISLLNQPARGGEGEKIRQTSCTPFLQDGYTIPAATRHTAFVLRKFDYGINLV